MKKTTKFNLMILGFWMLEFFLEQFDLKIWFGPIDTSMLWLLTIIYLFGFVFINIIADQKLKKFKLVVKSIAIIILLYISAPIALFSLISIPQAITKEHSPNGDVIYFRESSFLFATNNHIYERVAPFIVKDLEVDYGEDEVYEPINRETYETNWISDTEFEMRASDDQRIIEMFDLEVKANINSLDLNE